MLKSQLRKLIKARKRQFKEEDFRELSLSVMERLKGNAVFKNAETILMYYSLADEVDTHGIIDMLAENGKTVLLPAVLDDGNMEIRRYAGPGSLKHGSFSIMEPTGEAFEEYEAIDVAIIPGVGFDMNGNRLGRGKGYYDRFLARIPHAYKIGICFDFQKLAEVPVEDTDIRMDEVI